MEVQFVKDDMPLWNVELGLLPRPGDAVEIHEICFTVSEVLFVIHDDGNFVQVSLKR